MSNRIQMWVVVFLFCVVSQSVRADLRDSLEMAQAGCAEFQQRLRDLYPSVQTGVAQVPKFWNEQHNQETLPIFWWKRPGKDPSFPALAFLHGGVGSNSWRLPTNWREILDNYPGDVVAFDHRGEGCSKTLPSNLTPDNYSAYRVRTIVHDLEFLRKEVFGYRKWRIMGHSRGAAIAHFYLEMAPEGLEGVHAMGFSFMPLEMQREYTSVRALGFYRVAQAYLRQYPGDADRVATIRSLITEDMCWESFDGRTMCGPNVLDVLASNLSYVSSWPILHELLAKMIDRDSIRDIIEGQMKQNIYGHFNYILATNGLDFGNPSLLSSAHLRTSESMLYTQPFLAEIRYLSGSVEPTVGFEWEHGAETVDYQVIRQNLISNPGIRYFLYAGELDPVVPLEMFVYEEAQLADLEQFRFQILSGAGHDGWYDSQIIKNLMVRAYPELVRSTPCVELLSQPKVDTSSSRWKQIVAWVQTWWNRRSDRK